jgi:hypothetical protein
MEFETTRRLIRCAWKEAGQFDPWWSRCRLALSKAVREDGRIFKLEETPVEALYEVDDVWLVFLDLSGLDAHYCGCSGGARKVEIAFLGGSLCEHVIGCLLHDGKAHLLAVHFSLLAKAIAAQPFGRLPGLIIAGRHK